MLCRLTIRKMLPSAGGTEAFDVQFEDISAEQWRADFALNLDSVFYVTQVSSAEHSSSSITSTAYAIHMKTETSVWHIHAG